MDLQNVDFSAEAVRLGQELEIQKPDGAHRMPWIRADLRSWKEVSSLSQFATFDVILDKSTSDAIATSEPETFSSLCGDASNVCPTVRDIVYHNKGQVTLGPIALLALHLVPLTRKGVTWITLSYSNSRFDNIPFLAAYWTIVSRTPLKAPPGQVSSSVAKVPDVFHWVYVLRRK